MKSSNKKVLFSRFPVSVANDIQKICILSRDRNVGEFEAKTWASLQLLTCRDQNLCLDEKFNKTGKETISLRQYSYSSEPINGK